MDLSPGLPEDPNTVLCLMFQDYQALEATPTVAKAQVEEEWPLLPFDWPSGFNYDNADLLGNICGNNFVGMDFLREYEHSVKQPLSGGSNVTSVPSGSDTSCKT